MANRKNPWTGINPFLNSLLQTPGTDEQPALWHTFHVSHIAHLVDFLNQALPENYIALAEQSLQLREREEPFHPKPKRPQPDATIFQQEASRFPVLAHISVQPTWEADLMDTLETDDFLKAVIIRQISEQHTVGRPVTRIELLSPANKPGGSNYRVYREKRSESIQTNIPLIEIDYLHETPSPVPGLAIYPQDINSYPYYIAISYPRPSWEKGRLLVFGFRVNEIIPVLPIPLLGEESIIFDYNRVYQHTFEAGRWANFVDYTQLPVRFETYRADDQTRIREFMAQ